MIDEGVEALGKHMVIHLAGGWSVRVHLGMNGKWRRLHVRQRRPRDATLVMVVGPTAYVCQGAYRAETVRTAAAQRHPKVARLGTDLLAEPPAIDEAVRSARNGRGGGPAETQPVSTRGILPTGTILAA